MGAVKTLELKRVAFSFQMQNIRNESKIVVRKVSERNNLEDREKFCARIDISKEELCDLDSGESPSFP